jgi:hypothetical protein
MQKSMNDVPGIGEARTAVVVARNAVDGLIPGKF